MGNTIDVRTRCRLRIQALRDRLLVHLLLPALRLLDLKLVKGLIIPNRIRLRRRQ